MAIQVGGQQVISNSQGLTNITSIDSTTAASITAGGVGGTFPDLTGTTNNGTDSVTTTRNIFGIDGATNSASGSSVSSMTWTLPTGWSADLFDSGGAAGWRLDFQGVPSQNNSYIDMSVSATGGNNLSFERRTRYGNSHQGTSTSNSSNMRMTDYGIASSTTGKRGFYGSVHWDGEIGWFFRGGLTFAYGSSALIMHSAYSGWLYSGYNLSSITLTSSSGNFAWIGGVLYPVAKWPSL